MNVDGSEVLHEINDQEKLITPLGDHRPSEIKLNRMVQLERHYCSPGY
jgi:hypothetical protein